MPDPRDQNRLQVHLGIPVGSTGMAGSDRAGPVITFTLGQRCEAQLVDGNRR